MHSDYDTLEQLSSRIEALKSCSSDDTDALKLLECARDEIQTLRQENKRLEEESTLYQGKVCRFINSLHESFDKFSDFKYLTEDKKSTIDLDDSHVESVVEKLNKRYMDERLFDNDPTRYEYNRMAGLC